MLEELLRANRSYAATFAGGGLGARPARHLVVVTCMDARLDVYPLLGLHLGDAHILRNAGGRVTEDVIRSLVVSTEILGTDTVAVMQHTDCGMTKVTDASLRALVRERRGVDPEIEFLTTDEQVAAVRADVAFVRDHPLLAPDLEVFGLLYDVHTGAVTEL